MVGAALTWSVSNVNLFSKPVVFRDLVATYEGYHLWRKSAFLSCDYREGFSKGHGDRTAQGPRSRRPSTRCCSFDQLFLSRGLPRKAGSRCVRSTLLSDGLAA